MTGPSLSNARVLKEEALSTEEAKWIELRKITYNAPDNQTRTWESSVRRTRPKATDVDGVGVVAILEKSTGPEILLQKQYRPPLDKIVIEVPAGLVDEGESPETSAVRELKEETGYIGEVVKGGLSMTPVMFNDPGFCNTNVVMVHVSIDLSDPRNQDPKPELEEHEFIDCFSVPLAKLYEECQRLEREGYAIDARVGTLAEGIEVAKKWQIR